MAILSSTVFVLAQATLSLVYDGTDFLVGSGTGTLAKYSVHSSVSSPRSSYRKDEVSVYWDVDGLHVDARGLSRVADLSDIALSPKISSRDEILKTRSLLETGKRKKHPSGVSGSVRVGSQVFFLLNWRDDKDVTWLEALIRVGLDEDRPKPQLLGSFMGFSLAKGDIDDVLKPIPGGLEVLTSGPKGWGVARYQLQSGKFGFTQKGTTEVRGVSSDLGWVAESTPSGTVISRLLGQKRIEVAEVEDVVEFHTELRPLAVIKTNLGLALLNMESGQILNLPAQAQVRVIREGVLIWAETDPGAAVLVSGDRFIKMATAKSIA